MQRVIETIAAIAFVAVLIALWLWLTFHAFQSVRCIAGKIFQGALAVAVLSVGLLVLMSL